MRCIEKGCNYLFQLNEMEKFFDERKFEFYQKQLLADELRKAGLDSSLDSCPFCEFSMIIDNQNERVFKCLNCSIESCRSCKLISHLPLRCDEVNAQKEVII